MTRRGHIEAAEHSLWMARSARSQLDATIGIGWALLALADKTGEAHPSDTTTPEEGKRVSDYSKEWFRCVYRSMLDGKPVRVRHGEIVRDVVVSKIYIDREGGQWEMFDTDGYVWLYDDLVLASADSQPVGGAS